MLMMHNISVMMRDRGLVSINGPPIGSHPLRILESRDP